MIESRSPLGDWPGPEGSEVSVVHLAAEYLPYARTGGLGEAVRGIAHYQSAIGIPTTVILPLYRAIREHRRELEPWEDPFEVQVGDTSHVARLYKGVPEPSGPEVVFIDHNSFFDRRGIYGEDGVDYEDNVLRFAFFSRAALRALPLIQPGTVVLHPHDWHTALAPIYLRTAFSDDPAYADVASVLSVHNAGFQGHFPPDSLHDVGLPAELYHPSGMEWYGRANWLKGGLKFADMVTTVSPGHAEELRHEPGGFGLHHEFGALGSRLVGILNGIDTVDWNPETDREIVATYSADDLSGKAECKAWLQDELGLDSDPRTPLFGMAARMVEQKGIPLILQSGILERTDAQFVFLGTGDPTLEESLEDVTDRHPDRVVLTTEFTERREHLLLAAADLLLMPSLYEPCGLTQMRAQIYGTPPVARRTGGLSDTIEDGRTGFLFDDYRAAELVTAVVRAIDRFHQPEAWQRMVVEGMSRDFSWARSAKQYLDVYRRALEHRAAHAVGA